jgi:hypothetical protein
VKVFHALRRLLSTIPRPIRSDLRWFAQVAAICGVLYFAVGAAFDYWKEGVCLTEVLASVSGVAGFDFEVSTTNCWHSPETGVFVSKPGQSRKTLLFLYSSLEVPTITSVDERTIRIDLDAIDSVLCTKNTWEGLAIKYNIGLVRYSGTRAGSRECSPEGK